MDLQAATEIASRMRSLARRADYFGKSRQDILDEIIAIATDYEKAAVRIEAQMLEEMGV
jgi:hypothetical protein